MHYYNFILVSLGLLSTILDYFIHTWLTLLDTGCTITCYWINSYYERTCGSNMSRIALTLEDNFAFGANRWIYTLWYVAVRNHWYRVLLLPEDEVMLFYLPWGRNGVLNSFSTHVYTCTCTHVQNHIHTCTCTQCYTRHSPHSFTCVAFSALLKLILACNSSTSNRLLRSKVGMQRTVYWNTTAWWNTMSSKNAMVTPTWPKRNEEIKGSVHHPFMSVHHSFTSVHRALCV